MRSQELFTVFLGVFAPTIPLKAKLIVLEMNNDTNTIMGVGLIKNFIKMDQVHPYLFVGQLPPLHV